jgi:hypothetical protein
LLRRISNNQDSGRWNFKAYVWAQRFSAGMEDEQVRIKNRYVKGFSEGYFYKTKTVNLTIMLFKSS